MNQIEWKWLFSTHGFWFHHFMFYSWQNLTEVSGSCYRDWKLEKLIISFFTFPCLLYLNLNILLFPGILIQLAVAFKRTYFLLFLTQFLTNMHQIKNWISSLQVPWSFYGRKVTLPYILFTSTVKRPFTGTAADLLWLDVSEPLATKYHSFTWKFFHRVLQTIELQLCSHLIAFL